MFWCLVLGFFFPKEAADQTQLNLGGRRQLLAITCPQQCWGSSAEGDTGGRRAPGSETRPRSGVQPPKETTSVAYGGAHFGMSKSQTRGKGEAAQTPSGQGAGSARRGAGGVPFPVLPQPKGEAFAPLWAADTVTARCPSALARTRKALSAKTTFHSLWQRASASISAVISTQAGEVTSSHSILMKKTPTEM